MDIRVVKFPKVRVLLKRTQAEYASKSAAYAEGVAERAMREIRPAATWLYELRRRFATVMVALLTAWLFVHVTFGANGMMVYRTKRSEIHSLQKEIDSLRTENDLYDKQIEDLKTNPKTIEKEAREQLHYARPGEVVYVTPAPADEERPQIKSAQN